MNDISVYLANDHALFADGLSRILEEMPGLHVDRVFSDADNLLNALQITQPDLLFYDLSMPGLDNLQQARQIMDEYNQIKLVVLSVNEEADKSLEALQMGVHGLIMKDTSKEELFTAIGAVMNGDRFYAGKLSKKLEKKIAESQLKASLFSKREKEILLLLSNGKGSKAIAELLNISINTVDTHRKHILRKANCKTTVELVQAVRDNNWY
jgi:DNA-binding NarL/FixJ family response regulator